MLDGLTVTMVALVIGISVAVVTAACVYAIVAESRTPTCAMTADGFSVKSWLYKAQVTFRDVTEVGLLDRLPRILLRSNGFALGGKLRGRFEVEDLASCHMFVDAKRPPFVIVKTAERLLVLNLDDREKTEAVYATLRERCSRTASPVS